MANQTPPPNVHGQPNPAASAPPQFQSQLAAAGLEWNAILQLIQNMNWAQFFQFITALVAAFRGRAPVMAAAPGQAGVGHGTEHLKAHFEAIRDIAECGCQCCDQVGP